MEKKEEKKTKLTYEELEAYAQQTTMRAKQIYEENQKLKEALNTMSAQINYNDINLAFKVLEFKENFSEDFIKSVVSKLEEVLAPSSSEDTNKEE